LVRPEGIVSHPVATVISEVALVSSAVAPANDGLDMVRFLGLFRYARCCCAQAASEPKKH
jgi:hypothetical protein